MAANRQTLGAYRSHSSSGVMAPVVDALLVRAPSIVL
jgi:hypothetical protein